MMQLTTKRLLLKQLNEKEDYPFFEIIQLTDNYPIGKVGLKEETLEGKPVVELFYNVETAFRGKEYTLEAALAVCDYAFNILSINELFSIIDSNHTRNIEIAKRLGMYFWKETRLQERSVSIFALKKLTVESYQEVWKTIYHAEQKLLKNIFKDFPIEFVHVGSTAIPSSSAKPIIDIIGITPDITALDRCVRALEQVGYEAKGEFGLKQRRFFQKYYQPPIHLHIHEDSDPEVSRNLRFCEYLQHHQEKAKAYSNLKESLAKKFPGDRFSYNKAKTEMIKEIDIAAALWSKPKRRKKPQQRKKEWTLQEIRNALDVNWHLRMIYFAKYVTLLQRVSLPDVTIIRSEMDTFNFVLSATFNKEAIDERIQQVIDLFKDPPVPFSWWVGENDSPLDLKSKEFRLMSEEVGLYRHLDKELAPLPKHSFDIQHAVQLEQLLEIAQLKGKDAAAYALLYRQIPPLLYREGSSWEAYIAYINGKPVASGLLLLHANVGGIYDIATLPEYPEAGPILIETLLRRVQEQGYHMATTVVSREEIALYEQLGFTECYLFKKYLANSG